ncbi:hypothetical protein [Pedobacter sp. WC2423]|uniref:hypothetical protein n=1 Tax=Pedobacter sp. WC2423 TaxID=3234142 RepID=UPI003466416D
MKYFILIAISCFLSISTNAQTFSEWFSQKKTQKKYLIQQIAALQIYIGYAKKGYSIAKNGLTLVGDLKKGELNLHSGYFSALKSVNPKIKNYARVADIILLQIQVISNYKRLFRVVRKSDIMSISEINYLSAVFEKLLEDCSRATDELIDLTTTGKMGMTDGERLDRIDKLFYEMQRKSVFSQDFTNQTLVLINLRLKSKNDAYSIGKLY